MPEAKSNVKTTNQAGQSDVGTGAVAGMYTAPNFMQEANKQAKQNEINQLAVNQKNLTPETKYYVKAYAVNEKGTVLSAEKSFITKQDPGGSSFDTGGFDEENDWDKK